MSLYLKYRPRTAEDLVGQDHIKKTLINSISQGTVSHAYIFSGPRGTGKTSSARLIAKSVVCGADEELLQAAEAGHLVDIIEIDAASNRGIDEIRELRDKIQFAPVMGKAKVYIVDEVHMLTKEAFNALLKTLEEPPSHAFFILATTEIHKVPETILSRCQHFSFQRISKSDISSRLAYICDQENLTCEPEALDIIADNANGGLRDAISSLEQMISSGAVTLDYVQENLGLVSSKIVEAFATELIAGNAQTALEALEKIVYDGYDLSQFSREMIEYLREQMLETVKKQENPERIIQVIDVLQEASAKIKAATIPQLPLEIACVKLAGNLSEATAARKSSGGILGAFGIKEKKPEEKSAEPKESVKEVIAEEKVEKEQQAKEIQTVENLEQELSVESLKAVWAKVVEAVPSPTVKAAMKSAKILSLTGDILKLEASTDFYIDNINNSKGNGEIIAAIDGIFHQRIKVQAEKEGGINLTSKAQETVQKEEEKEDTNIVDMANEIFGN